ncbi:MAG: hypothetical protein MUE75_00160 [Algoriphagus sp.]|jgi:hypothetical protein|nr:hypothetical protein [Algoriphagus sp.]
MENKIRQIHIYLFFIFFDEYYCQKNEKHELGIDSREEKFPVIEVENGPVDTLLAEKGKVLMPTAISVSVTGKPIKSKVLPFSY